MIAMKPRVTNLQLPTCAYSFRSGWAYAKVDGQPMKLYTSRSDRSDYREHCNDVEAKFAAGEGQPAPEYA